MRWLVLLFLASPAGAEAWACSFEAVCRAGSPCTGATWQLQIRGTEDAAVLVSAQGETPLTQLSEQAYASPDLLVTISATGTATLTAHDLPARSYLGYCEVAE